MPEARARMAELDRGGRMVSTLSRKLDLLLLIAFGRKDPLCAFLEKPVPSRMFPEGNSVAKFTARVGQRHAEQFRQADRNMAIVSAVVATTLAILFSWNMRGWQGIW